MNRGLNYYRLGEFDKAIEFYQQALRIAKEVENKDLEGKAYMNLGNACRSLGDSEKAIKFHQQALNISKEVGNKDSEGSVYVSLGCAFHSLGDFKTAIELHQQALSISKEVGNKYLEGSVYGSLGCAYNSLGDFKTAIKFHQQALSISKEVGNIDSEGSAYTNLGKAYHSLCDFKTAIELHQQALSIIKEVGNKDLEGSVYVSLGSAFHSLGDFKTAIKFHQQALSISKEVGNKDAEGGAYANLGNTYHSLGDFKTAMEFHQKALSISKEVGRKDLEGPVYANLGSFYDSLGDFKTAIEFHQQALSISKEVGNKILEGSIYTNLGSTYDSLGDFKTAIEFHQQALSITKEVGNKDLEETVYTNLGNAYRALGDFKTAIKFHQQALSICKEVGKKNLEGLAFDLAHCYYSEGDYEKAAKRYQQTLNIAKETGNTPLEGSSYLSLGNVYSSLGNFKAAMEFYQQALSIAKEVGIKNSEGCAYENLGTVYFSLRDFKTAIEYHEKALSIAKETGNKLFEAKAYDSLGDDHHLDDFCTAEDFYKRSVRLFDELRGLLQSNDKWKIDSRNKQKATYSKLWLVQLQQNKTVEALFTAERGRAQALMDLMESQYGVKSVHPVSAEKTNTISSISSHLPSQTIFLAEVPSVLNFWVLQKGGLCQFAQKAISDSLESLTHKTYKQIGVFQKVMCEKRSLDGPADEESEEVPYQNRDENSKASVEGEMDALKALSDVVLGTISHLLQSDEVIVVPDSPLFLVPYAALLDQHSRYLSETLTIRLVPTLTSLKLMTECPDEYHSTSGALLVGDPWVEGILFRGRRIRQLPAAKEEVEMIGAILNIKALTGKEATKPEVLSRLNSVALVHIAAHGRAETGEIFLSPNPTVAKKKLKEEDFLLTMADVLNAKLRARLVVLSCCHSGRGKIKAEGVVGLARAFLGAGARCVLASLWAISDEATLQFMRYFYEHLAEGKSASKALHQTMKQMRESGNFSDIKYWAPFVLIGDDVTLNFGHLR